MLEILLATVVVENSQPGIMIMMVFGEIVHQDLEDLIGMEVVHMQIH